jgi:hypothetical protein
MTTIPGNQPILQPHSNDTGTIFDDIFTENYYGNFIVEEVGTGYSVLANLRSGNSMLAVYSRYFLNMIGNVMVTLRWNASIFDRGHVSISTHYNLVENATSPPNFNRYMLQQSLPVVVPITRGMHRFKTYMAMNPIRQQSDLAERINFWLNEDVVLHNFSLEPPVVTTPLTFSMYITPLEDFRLERPQIDYNFRTLTFQFAHEVYAISDCSGQLPYELVKATGTKESQLVKKIKELTLGKKLSDDESAKHSRENNLGEDVQREE